MATIRKYQSASMFPMIGADPVCAYWLIELVVLVDVGDGVGDGEGVGDAVCAVATANRLRSKAIVSRAKPYLLKQFIL